MRRLFIALSLLMPLSTIAAEVGFEIAAPGVNIGINLPIYPELVLVPGSPVYYAPRAQANYFFYDGLYWVYRNDHWYSSEWYNGPWQAVDPQYVPLFVLRIPVRYYRQPPTYFRRWHAEAPPHWGEHWGRDWETEHHGWDRRDGRPVPRPAPLPTYQRKYTGSHYPDARERQQVIRSEHYRYQPRETISQEHFKQPADRSAPRPEAKRPAAPETRPPQAAPRNEPATPPHVQPGRPPVAHPETRREAPGSAPAAPTERHRPTEPTPQRPLAEPAMQRQPANENRHEREVAPAQPGKEQSKEPGKGRDNRGDEHGPDRR